MNQLNDGCCFTPIIAPSIKINELERKLTNCIFQISSLITPGKYTPLRSIGSSMAQRNGG